MFVYRSCRQICLFDRNLGAHPPLGASKCPSLEPVTVCIDEMLFLLLYPALLNEGNGVG